MVVAANGNDPTVNINAVFNINPSALSFNPSNWRELYWHNENGLQRLDLGNRTVSAVLADHVAAYTFAGDRIIYVSNASNPASLWSLDSGGRKQQLVRKLPASTGYELAYATYIGTPEVAVVAQDTRQTTLYSEVYNQPVVVTLPATGLHTSFNGDGRFLLQSDENHIATYDLQENTTYTFPNSVEPISGLNWFDTYHLLYISGGRVTLSEFDGNYAIPLAASDGSIPISTSNDRSVIMTAPTASGGTQIKAVVIRP
jgi:hypothetical protein